MKRVLFACSFFVVACAGDSKAPSPDATPAAAAFGAACVTVTDTGSTECASGVCTNTIDQLGHPVCSQLCAVGTDTSCPAGSTGMQKCNGKGYCKP